MGDGTGAVMLDGKMEDDASLKQCLVILELAERLSRHRPRAGRLYAAVPATAEGSGHVSGAPAAYRPRRSVLYMPSSNERALEKAKTLPVDALILDLEDAVAPDAKDAARENACAAARSGDYGRRELTIRVNGIGTQWHDADLAAACAAGPDGIVVPKVGSRRGGAPARRRDGAAGAPDAHGSGPWSRPRRPCSHCEEIAAAVRAAGGARHGHQRPGQGAGAPSTCPAGTPLLTALSPVPARCPRRRAP